MLESEIISREEVVVEKKNREGEREKIGSEWFNWHAQFLSQDLETIT